jgi:AcrR family transcriptional regulator
MSAEPAVTESRAERRKRETRQRLLDAALEVFLRRGFDASTTAQIAEAADVGAGTFYLHFRDKRDAYESLARHAAREILSRWEERLKPETRAGEQVALGLEAAATFWSENRERARLLLEGGPSFGSESHLRLVEEVAALVRRRGAARDNDSAETMATVMVGLGIELGRLIVAGDRKRLSPAIGGTIDLVRRAFGRGATAIR